MFTDMVGYSALTQHNEALALELLDEHRRLLRELFPRFNGREVETTGDGFLVEFSSALEATRCAIEIQSRLVEENRSRPPIKHIQIRIGVHVGDVVHKDGKVLGDAVNIAARIEPLAEPGGVCISNAVYEQVRNKMELALMRLGTPELKNISVPIEVYHVVLPWQKAPSHASKSWSAPRRQYRASLLGTVVLAILAVGGGIRFVIHKNAPAATKDSGSKSATNRTVAVPGPIESLAVLPFDNFSGDTNKNYVADGLTDELTGKLAQISALKKVVSRTTMMPYRGSKKSISAIGQELKVDAVVEGSVVLNGTRVRVKVQLIEAASDRHIWSDTYDRDTADIIQLQNDVTLAMAQAIRVVLTPEEHTRLSKARSVNPEAYENYLMGKILNSNYNDADNLKAIVLLERAVALDKGFAPAYAALAAAYIDRLYNYAPQDYKTWEPKTALRVQQALEIDPESAEAYVARAKILWSPVRNFRHDEAVADLQRAVRLDPKLSEAHYLLGLVYGHTGLLDEAVAALRTASALDPSATTPLVDEASVHLWKGDYQQAMPLWSKIQRGAGWQFFVGSHKAWTLFALQRTNDANSLLEEFRKAFPEDDTGELAGMKAVLLAAADDGTGAKAEIEKATSKETRYGEFHHTAYLIASAYARLGKPREALDALKKAAATGFPNYRLFEKDPNLNNLRDNEEFREFLKEQAKEWRGRKETWLKTGTEVRSSTTH